MLPKQQQEERAARVQGHGFASLVFMDDSQKLRKQNILHLTRLLLQYTTTTITTELISYHLTIDPFH